MRSVPRLGGARAADGGRRRLQAIEGNVPDLLDLPPDAPSTPVVPTSCRSAASTRRCCVRWRGDRPGARLPASSTTIRTDGRDERHIEPS